MLSVVLTAIPFWLVMGKVLAEQADHRRWSSWRFAAVQIVVHMIYFLHMNAKSEGGWSMMALIFTHRAGGHRADRLALGDVPPQREHDADATR